MPDNFLPTVLGMGYFEPSCTNGHGAGRGHCDPVLLARDAENSRFLLDLILVCISHLISRRGDLD